MEHPANTRCRRPRGTATASAWLVRAVLVLAAGLPPVRGYGTELSSTVSVFRFVDLNTNMWLDGFNQTSCWIQVNRAACTGATKVNFLITHYFIDADKDFVPDYYCYKPTSSAACLPFDAVAVKAYMTLLQPCLKHAADLGLDISITPHLDDGLNSGVWRNPMRINPIKEFQGWSYYSAVLLPVAQALSKVLTPTTRVWFALQGEMSRMVVEYPTEHQRILAPLKYAILQEGKGRYANNVRMGVSVNFNKLCGAQDCQASDVAPAGNLSAAAVQALFNAVDFVGLSAYPMYGNLESSTVALAGQLKLFGVDLAVLTTNAGKELIFSEFGCGGGASVSGETPARSVSEAIATPYYGVFGAYTRRLDPWDNHLPRERVISATQQLLRKWYGTVMLWLQRKGGPTYRVDHVFIWNLNSWDVQGIHPESTTKEGSYRDPIISADIRAYNLRINGKPNLPPNPSY